MLKSPEQRSPSCNRGKTMRDFEEELNNLRRENFDLKMRIYVLNEHLELIQSVDNIEEIYDIHKKLKKDINSLKAEVADKEDLILKTGDAMNLLSNKHREEMALLRVKAQEEIDQYQEVITRLRQELSIKDKSLPRNQQEFDDSSAMYAMAFALNGKNYSESNIQEDHSYILEEQVYKLETDLSVKSKEIEESDEKIKRLENEISLLKEHTKSVENELKEKTLKIEDLYFDIRQREVQIVSLHNKVSTLGESLKKKDNKIELMTVRLNSVKNLEETTESCKQKLDLSRNENNALQEQITALHERILRKSIPNNRMSLSPLEKEQDSICTACIDRVKLQNKCTQLKDALSDKERSLEEAKVEQVKTIRALQGFMKANKCLNRDLENLQIQLKKEDNTEHSSHVEEAQNKPEMSDSCIVSENKESIEELEKQIQILKESVVEKELRLKEFEKRMMESCTCGREERVEELELLVDTLKSQLDSILLKEGSTISGQTAEFKAKMEAKDKCIEQLNEELRKRTFNLQELVNTELWDKNREIEKLNKICEKKQNETKELRSKMDSQQSELNELNIKIQELSDNINCKLTKKDVNCLKEQLDQEKVQNILLKDRCKDLENEMIKSEKARKELVNACVLLQTRLEELVSFMDSLIPSIEGKNRKIIQEAIERSREASRTLSLSIYEESSFLQPTPILPDFSEVDFRCDSFNLTSSLVDKSSLVCPNSEVNEIRLQLETVVNKLDKASQPSKIPVITHMKEKDRLALIELSAMTQSFVLDEITEGSLPETLSEDTESAQSKKGSSCNITLKPKKTAETADVSESEEWSEPDRDVSKARIGIENVPPTTAKTPIDSTTDQSEISDKQNSSKRRFKGNEVRKMYSKLKLLSDEVETLKTERLSPCKSPDSNFSLPINDQFSTANMIEKFLGGQKDIDVILKQIESIKNELRTVISDNEQRTLELLLNDIIKRLKRFQILCQEAESFLVQNETDKKDLCLKIFDKDRKFENTNSFLMKLQSELKEKENEVLEKQCALLELKNQLLILENNNKTVETRLADANSKLQSYLKNEEKEKMIWREKHIQEISKLQSLLKHNQDEYHKENLQLHLLLDKTNEKIEEANLMLMHSENEHKQQLDMIIKENKACVEEEVNKRMDIERKLIISYEMQADLRNQLDNELTNTRTIGSAQRKLESWWRKRMQEVEGACLERESDLRRRLDAATLSTSQAVLERTRLANDKIRLQCELRRRDETSHEVKVALEQRVSELEEANSELEKKLACLKLPRSEPGSPTNNFARQRSNPTSDYTSDPDQHGSNSNLWFPVCGRNNNCSPDLGIESDHGRLSSLDALPSPKAHGDTNQLKIENGELREQLGKMKQALGKALSLLEDSKQRKKQVERAICHQIHKTNKILTKARLNLVEPSDENEI